MDAPYEYDHPRSPFTVPQRSVNSVPSYNGNGREAHYRKFYGPSPQDEPDRKPPPKPNPLSMADYINVYGYVALDWRLRDGLLKLVYKGGRVVVVPV